MSDISLIIVAYAIGIFGWAVTHGWVLAPLIAVAWLLLVVLELRSRRAARSTVSVTQRDADVPAQPERAAPVSARPGRVGELVGARV